MGHLDGQVVVVTGAGRGIGRAHAEFAAAEGARVVVNDTGGDTNGVGLSAETAKSVAEDIVSRGGVAVADIHDVATEAEGVVQTAIDTFGKVDCLVNNAGVIAQGSLDELTVEQIERMLDIIALGSISTIRAAWPNMKERGYGRIVNTSSCSIFGVGGAPMYLTGKAAIIGLTKALAKDGAPFGIKVNAIMPMGYSRMADTQAGLAEFMKENFSPNLISPFVGALLVPDTPCTGELFAVAGGRAARVFLGTVPGLVGFKSIDDCLDGFDQIMAAPSYAAPTSMDEEIGYEYEHLGIDLSSLGIDLDMLGTGIS